MKVLTKLTKLNLKRCHGYNFFLKMDLYIFNVDFALKEFQWFGDDGQVKMLPDPVCESPIRQVPESKIDSFPIVEYVKVT